MNPIPYIIARCKEASTWLGIVGAIGGGQAFAHPWDYLAVAGGCIAVFCPQPKRRDGCP